MAKRDIGKELKDGLTDALAHSRGEIELRETARPTLKERALTGAGEILPRGMTCNEDTPAVQCALWGLREGLALTISIVHDHRIEDGPMLRHRIENAIRALAKEGDDE